MIAGGFTFTNLVLPLAILVALAAALPWLLLPRGTRSQRAVAWVFVISCLVLALAAAVLVMGSAALEGARPLEPFRHAPLAALGNLARVVALSALLWAPILMLIAYMQSMQVEKRRGEDMVRK